MSNIQSLALSALLLSAHGQDSKPESGRAIVDVVRNSSVENPEQIRTWFDFNGDHVPDVYFFRPPYNDTSSYQESLVVLSSLGWSEISKVEWPKRETPFLIRCVAIKDLDGDKCDEIVAITEEEKGSHAVVRSGRTQAILFAVGCDGYELECVQATRVTPKSSVRLMIKERPWSGSGAGRLRQFSSAGTEVARVELESTSRSESTYFGQCALIDDVNGDGIPDIVASSPHFRSVPEAGTGCVWILSGTLDKKLLRIDAEPGHSELGRSLQVIHDVDNDGLRDLAVGGGSYPATGIGNADYIRVYSSRSGRLIREIRSEFELGGFGTSMLAVGDVDGDQLEELLVSAPRESVRLEDDRPGGTLTLLSSGTGRVIWRRVVTDDSAQVGICGVAACGDVDSDGVADAVFQGSTHYYFVSSRFGDVIRKERWR